MSTQLLSLLILLPNLGQEENSLEMRCKQSSFGPFRYFYLPICNYFELILWRSTMPFPIRNLNYFELLLVPLSTPVPFGDLSRNFTDL